MHNAQTRLWAHLCTFELSLACVNTNLRIYRSSSATSPSASSPRTSGKSFSGSSVPLPPALSCLQRDIPPWRQRLPLPLSPTGPELQPPRTPTPLFLPLPHTAHAPLLRTGMLLCTRAHIRGQTNSTPAGTELVQCCHDCCADTGPLHAYCMHTACTLHARCMHTACIPHARCSMHTACTLHARCMQAACTLHARGMHTACTRHAHCMHAARTLFAHCL